MMSIRNMSLGGKVVVLGFMGFAAGCSSETTPERVGTKSHNRELSESVELKPKLNVQQKHEGKTKMAAELTDATFDEAIKSGVVLVDFWATWCPPCRVQGPIIDTLAGEYEGRATLAKLDVDSNQGVAGKFSVRSIPTLIIFKDGEAVETMVGLQTEEKLREKLDALLK